MNINHLAVSIASLIVLLVSIALFSQIMTHGSEFISELFSLYSLGAIAGCGLAAIWLLGEFAGQDD